MLPDHKPIKIDDIFTREELDRADNFWKGNRKELHKNLKEKIILPAIARIDAITEQQNDAEYWAYLLEYFLDAEHSRKER